LFEITLTLTIILGATTVGAAIEYYLQLRHVQREYRRAAETVGDIVVSVKREFQNQGARLEAISYKLETLASRDSSSPSRTAEIETRLSALKEEVDRVTNELHSMLTKLDDANSKVLDAFASQQLLNDKVIRLEEQAQQSLLQARPEIGAVIPIRRERALAPLTETELSVLEKLVKEGPKTVPNIKEKLH